MVMLNDQNNGVLESLEIETEKKCSRYVSVFHEDIYETDI